VRGHALNADAPQSHAARTLTPSLIESEKKLQFSRKATYSRGCCWQVYKIFGALAEQ